MRFSIINRVLGWQAWKKPRARRSIRSKNQKRKARPLFPKSSSRSARRTRKLIKRKPYKSPDKVRSAIFNLTAKSCFACISAWIVFEVFMTLFLLEK